MTKTEPARMTEDQVKELVLDLVHGQVFTALDCPPDLIGMVVMPIGLGLLADFDLDLVGNIVERMDRAGERGINGYPVFMSCRVVHKADWEVVLDRAIKVQKVINEAME